MNIKQTCIASYFLVVVFDPQHKKKKMLLGFAFGLTSLSNQMRFGGLRKTARGLSDATR